MQQIKTQRAIWGPCVSMFYNGKTYQQLFFVNVVCGEGVTLVWSTEPTTDD